MAISSHIVRITNYPHLDDIVEGNWWKNSKNDGLNHVKLVDDVLSPCRYDMVVNKIQRKRQEKTYYSINRNNLRCRSKWHIHSACWALVLWFWLRCIISANAEKYIDSRDSSENEVYLKKKEKKKTVLAEWKLKRCWIDIQNIMMTIISKTVTSLKRIFNTKHETLIITHIA